MITAAAAVETPEQHHLPPSRLHQQQLLQNNKFLSAAVAPPAVAVNSSLKNNQQLHRKYCNPHRHKSQTLLDQRWQQRHRQMPRYFYLICFHEQKFYEAFNKRPFQLRRLVVLSNLSLLTQLRSSCRPRLRCLHHQAPVVVARQGQLLLQLPPTLKQGGKIHP